MLSMGAIVYMRQKRENSWARSGGGHEAFAIFLQTVLAAPFVGARSGSNAMLSVLAQMMCFEWMYFSECPVFPHFPDDVIGRGARSSG
jgi:hypothetical protein